MLRICGSASYRHLETKRSYVFLEVVRLNFVLGIIHGPPSHHSRRPFSSYIGPSLMKLMSLLQPFMFFTPNAMMIESIWMLMCTNCRDCDSLETVPLYE